MCVRAIVEHGYQCIVDEKSHIIATNAQRSIALQQICQIAGIVLAARNGSATPKAGDGFEMDAIASCYIGGAAVAGGAGTIVGAVVGAFIMGILNNGMSLMGFTTDVQKIFKGMVLLLAVTLDVLSKRKKG